MNIPITLIGVAKSNLVEREKCGIKQRNFLLIQSKSLKKSRLRIEAAVYKSSVYIKTLFNNHL